MMSLIHSIEKEGAYDKGQKNAPSMSSLKTNFTLDPFKAIRVIEENIVANFPFDSRAKKVKLTIKVTKPKQPIKKKLYIKSTTVLSQSSWTYFVLLYICIFNHLINNPLEKELINRDKQLFQMLFFIIRIIWILKNI